MPSQLKNAGNVTQTNPNGSFTFETWSNIGNAQTIGDGTFATCVMNPNGSTPYTYQSYNIDWSGFGFSLPSNAVIRGIMIEVEGLFSGGSPYLNGVWMETPSGTIKGDTGHIITGFSGSTSIQSTGGATDLFSSSWSLGDLSTLHVVAIALNISTSSSSTLSIGGCRVTVYYAIPHRGWGSTVYKQVAYASNARTLQSVRPQFVTPGYLRNNRAGFAYKRAALLRFYTFVANTSQNFFKSMISFSAPAKETFFKSLGALTGPTTQVFFKRYIVPCVETFYRGLGAITAATTQSFRRVRKRVYGGR